MRPILIGQAPGPNTDPDYPLYPVPSTSAGGRLAQLMGVDGHAYLDLFDRANVLYRFPGKVKKEDKFPVREARVAAEAMRPLLRGRDIVLVGRGVAEAFGYPSALLGFHEWLADPKWGYRVAVVPHTSGRSRWYNVAQNKAEAWRFWSALLADVTPAERKLLSSVQGGRI